MKICVCVKHVPDTAATIKLAGDKGFEDSEIKFVSNPYDEYGIEEAVSLVESQGRPDIQSILCQGIRKPDEEGECRNQR